MDLAHTDTKKAPRVWDAFVFAVKKLHQLISAITTELKSGCCGCSALGTELRLEVCVLLNRSSVSCILLGGSSISCALLRGNIVACVVITCVVIVCRIVVVCVVVGLTVLVAAIYRSSVILHCSSEAAEIRELSI